MVEMVQPAGSVMQKAAGDDEGRQLPTTSGRRRASDGERRPDHVNSVA
jgi:hypothetical protein